MHFSHRAFTCTAAIECCRCCLQYLQSGIDCGCRLALTAARRGRRYTVLFGRVNSRVLDETKRGSHQLELLTGGLLFQNARDLLQHRGPIRALQSLPGDEARSRCACSADRAVRRQAGDRSEAGESVAGTFERVLAARALASHARRRAIEYSALHFGVA